MDDLRESSLGGIGVDEGVGVVGRDMASTDDVRRMAPPMRARKDLGLGLLIGWIPVPDADEE
jgi:hypothetical protein